MKILLVEDNQLLAKSIIRGLKQEKIFVEHFVRGDDGERFFQNHYEEIDLAILDWMLPEKSGIEISKNIREQGIKTPILFLTAKSDIEDKVKGFESGADDYLVKPFDFQELLVRIKALARRNKKGVQEEKIKITKSVLIDLNKREVFKNGKVVELSPKEFALLETLLKYKGKALSRNELFNHINDFADVPWSNSIDVYIKNLRKKLFYDEKEIIKTVRGVGYRLD